MCGGSLEITEGMTVCECEYCGTKQTLPKTDNEQNLNMINRANHFRQQCEFDKAMEIYERLLNNSEGDSEIYWSIVLCRYGIEYVDDPLTQKKIATCHRTQYKSILEDTDYIEAISHADVQQKEIYQKEAEYIDGIQKGILEISNKEEPFDIFICYKESDESGKRTPDSVLAQELYYQLTREGFKVFFSRITLEDKLGTAYEPYIFAALNSSKVMVVVGTKVEYFNAVWVRNEWSRFLMLMQNDRSKTLIPAYKDIDPYDLPDALSMFQAQDMSKLGFMQDLIRGIEKIVKSEPKQPVVKEIVIKSSPANANVENLLKRGMLSLEDGDWKKANEFFEQVLNENVEEPRAYLGKLMAELKLNFENQFMDNKSNFSNSDNYKKAIRFGDSDFKEKLENYNKQSFYNKALKKMNNSKNENDYIAAKEMFLSLGNYSNSAEMADKCEENAKECIYQRACKESSEASTEGIWTHLAEIFGSISEYKDSDEQKRICEENAKECIYQRACNGKTRVFTETNWMELANMFGSISGYKDSDEQERICKENAEIARKEIIYSSALRAQSLDTIADLTDAIKKFESIREFSDSNKQIKICENRIEEIQLIVEEYKKAEILRQKKRKRNRIIAISLICFITASAIVYSTLITSHSIYSTAVEKMNKGEYDEAISMFSEIQHY
ncbi:MAG: toll/interleukin-1 receptor domain-containing protein, partial [Ruminiclostridium sp.]|nr:toll/interleukin-1 receptor domain-containing protein [Ruminiclostridium sp.]